MMKKMRKVFLFLSFLMLSMSFFACNNKIVVEMQLGSYSEIKEIKRNDSVKNQDFDLLYGIEGLYYDKEYKVKYQEEPISDDITLYVKTSKVSPMDLTKDTWDEIREDYLQYRVNNVKTILEYYFGTYDSYVAATYCELSNQESTSDRIAGITFEYPNSNTIRLWKNGEFYTLREAYYDEKDLTEASLEKLFHQFKQIMDCKLTIEMRSGSYSEIKHIKRNESINKQDFELFGINGFYYDKECKVKYHEEPITEDLTLYVQSSKIVAPMDLNNETWDKIRKDYANLGEYLTITPGGLPTLEYYFGTYDGYVAAIYREIAIMVLTREGVGGYVFKYPDSNKMRLWKNGKFYTLWEAYYEEKDLTKESLEDLYNHFKILMWRQYN